MSKIISQAINSARQQNIIRYSQMTTEEILEEIGMTAKQMKEYGLTRQQLIAELSEPND